MQVVIMAAGKGTRLHPLSLTRPKPLMPFCGTTILKNNLDEISKLKVKEVIIIVGYLKDKMKKYIAGLDYKFNVKIIEQKTLSGTGGAIKECEEFLKEEFIVLNGDDKYSSDDIKKLSGCDYGILGYYVDDVRDFGAIEAEGDKLKSFVEKPNKKISGYVNIGAYKFKKDLLKKKIVKSKRGELELPDYFISTKNVKVIEANFWQPMTYPWNLLDSTIKHLENFKFEKKGKVEKGATLKGKVHVGKNTIIKSGAYIEGPVYIGEDCTIGPNCYIRANSSIGNNCYVGNAVEIKASVIMDNVCIGHLSYIGDSIIGEGSNIAAGNITANLRHDGETVKTPVKNVMVDTDRRKLGAIIGDGVHTGINTSFYPGRKVWPDKTTLPGNVVKKDIK